MPAWTNAYVGSLTERFDGITDGLTDRLDAIVDGRTAPAIDDITLGSGRRVRAAVMFFDIAGFSSRTSSANLETTKQTLYMLDCVIPMIMHVVFDYGGYVEKNTGDGVMAIVGVGTDDSTRANAALDIAVSALFVIREIVNPHLVGQGIEPISVKVGLDTGTLLLARIGTPKGSARHDRSFLTAVGPPANLASKLQEEASGGEIWTGDITRTHASDYRYNWFELKTPIGWTWTYTSGDPAINGTRYDIWRYTGIRNPPIV